MQSKTIKLQWKSLILKTYNKRYIIHYENLIFTIFTVNIQSIVSFSIMMTKLTRLSHFHSLLCNFTVIFNYNLDLEHCIINYCNVHYSLNLNLWPRWWYNWRVCRYQRGNQNPYIEEEQTTQWPKEKVQKDKQRSTKHIYKTKDRVTQAPLKTGSELRCSRRVSSSCSTSGIRRVNLVTNPVITHEWGKDREVFATSGSYPGSICDTDIS